MEILYKKKSPKMIFFDHVAFVWFRCYDFLSHVNRIVTHIDLFYIYLDFFRSLPLLLLRQSVSCIPGLRSFIGDAFRFSRASFIHHIPWTFPFFATSVSAWRHITVSTNYYKSMILFKMKVLFQNWQFITLKVHFGCAQVSLLLFKTFV